MLKFYSDVHIARQVSIQLRRRGIDAVHCGEVGMENAPDIEHLQRATSEGRVIITLDQDFARLDKQWKDAGKIHGGIFLCLPHLQGEGSIGRIVELCVTYCELIAGGAGTYQDDVADRITFLG
ncbi:MAG: DUF5615 family PIN-like protein [Anaerolineae bacterium]|nr:DUF5615 family PIN-like protein [Anaerolineae bacterium]